MGLKEKLLAREATLGVIGLGYVGLPLAVEKAKAGFKVYGFDVQKEKVDMVNAGKNYIGDVVNEDLEALVKAGQLVATSNFADAAKCDCVCICVPTPLDAHQQPDISYVRSSTESIMPYVHKDMLVVLESTTYPGTTEELCKPILEKSGLKCGEDFYLAFSPERVDPGNLIYKTKNTPKGRRRLHARAPRSPRPCMRPSLKRLSIKSPLPPSPRWRRSSRTPTAT